MKIILGLLLLNFSAFAQEMSVSEAMMILDQHASAIKALEVGQQLAQESYEMHTGCTIHEKNILTVAEVNTEFALVLNEQTTDDKCQKTVTTKKFIIKDFVIDYPSLRAQMVEKFSSGWKFNRKENLMTFEQTVGARKWTFQYDLRYAVLGNWGHHHHSYPGVEVHNIRNFLARRIVTQSELQGLKVCTRNAIDLKIEKCE